MRVLSFMMAVRAKPRVADVDMCDCKTVSKASRTSSSVTWYKQTKGERRRILQRAITRCTPMTQIALPAWVLCPRTLLSAASLHTPLYTSRLPEPGIAETERHPRTQTFKSARVSQRAFKKHSESLAERNLACLILTCEMSVTSAL